MGIKCYMITPTMTGLRSLRRYRESGKAPIDKCPASGLGYHNAHRLITARAKVTLEPDGVYSIAKGRPVPHADKRWPRRCACGYVFRSTDRYQVWTERHYKRADTGALVTLRNAPPGAMWDAPWIQNYKGPDGRCLVVKTPGGDWMIDGPAYPRDGSGPHYPAWTRTGTPPKITVTPSISIGDPESYHGFLTGGVLSSV